jgi:tetratricopeptide (TPR) repeat protein
MRPREHSAVPKTTRHPSDRYIAFGTGKRMATTPRWKGVAILLVAVLAASALAGQAAETAPLCKSSAGAASPRPAPAERSQDSGHQALERALADLDAAGEQSSRMRHRRAELLFRLGRFADAVQAYDEAAQGGDPHDEFSCWERGLAQYYAGDFQAAAAQFQRYHEVGPRDIENGLWYFLCTAKTVGIEAARKAFFDYPEKVRPPFPALLALYRGLGDAEAVLQQAESGDLSAGERNERRFYAHYYTGKYYEIAGEADQARAHLEQALHHEIPHFMFACAREDARRLGVMISDTELKP